MPNFLSFHRLKYDGVGCFIWKVLKIKCLDDFWLEDFERKIKTPLIFVLHLWIKGDTNIKGESIIGISIDFFSFVKITS